MFDEMAGGFRGFEVVGYKLKDYKHELNKHIKSKFEELQVLVTLLILDIYKIRLDTSLNDFKLCKSNILYIIG
jgi:hypothetical protein